MKRKVSVLKGLAAFAGASFGTMLPATAAVGPEVIFTKIPTHPTSLVPGARDLAGDLAATNFRALEQLTVSPDGSMWMIIARTQQGSDLETIMLVGSGASGTTFLQEGQPVPGAAGELIDFFNTIGRFNSSNQFACSLRARGGSSATFQKIMLYNGGTTPAPGDFTLVARGGNSPGGDLITGLTDLAPNPSGDERIGNSLGSIHLLDSGVIGGHDGSIINIHTSRRPAIVYSSAAVPGGGLVTFNKFKQVGLDTFLDLDGVTPRTYASSTGGLGSNSFYTSLDGTRWAVRGEILGAPTNANQVLVVNDKAELQEGVALPGASASDLVLSIVASDVAPNNDWYARGTRSATVGGTNNGAWFVKNGALLAMTGNPISTPATGPVENWGATILAVTVNGNGDWVVVGKTDNPDTAIDDVVVVNGEVVLREGDPIDLDGNGKYDDDVFVGRGVNTNAAFETDDVNLTDDMVLYMFINIRDGAGNDLNSSPAFTSPQAFVRLELKPNPPPVCAADIAPAEGDGVVGVPDLLAVIGAWGPCPGDCPPNCAADINADCSVGVPDLLAVIGNWGPCPR